MLARLYADNFRCFSSFTLEIEPLTVLLGSNGAGKSTLLDLISRLRDFILGRAKSIDLFPTAALTRWDTRNEQTFEIAIRLPAGEFLYRLRISHSRQQALNKVVEERLSLDGKPLFAADDKNIQLYIDNHAAGPQLLPDWHISGISRIQRRADNTKLWMFRDAIERLFVLSINPALVGAVSEEKQPVTIPRPDCSDFAAWLDYVNSAEPLARQATEQNLSTGGLPAFRAFKIDQQGDSKIVRCVFKTDASKADFRLDELSSGQIAMIILETVLGVVEERRGILLLDEPGNFLGISEIQPLLTRLQDAALEGRFQVMLTAHHPVAVDFLARGYGVWLDREPNGYTRQYKLKIADDIQEKNGRPRVSDLIARGWLAELGVKSLAPPLSSQDSTT